MLELKEPSTINLRSNHDTGKLIEDRVNGPGFTNRCFKCYAPFLYITLQKYQKKYQISKYQKYQKFEEKTKNIHFQ